MNCNWRSSLEWRNSGLELSTASDLACKLFDANITQIYGFYDEPSVGGIEKSMADMISADPDFVMGRTLKFVSELKGGMGNPQNFKVEMESILDLAECKVITKREKRHVEAAHFLFKGHLDKAADCWESILSDYHTDAVALNHAYYANFCLGRSTRLRDMLSGILPHWTSSVPLYSYLYGLYAFGLEETNFYSEAEKRAKQALNLNDKDVWAIHTLTHVYDSQGLADKGINFLTATSKNWQINNALTCHHFWHLGLMHIEKGDTEAAIEIFENEIAKACKSKIPFSLNDAASLLCRLELSGVDVGGKWDEVFVNYESYSKDNTSSFNDIHFALSCLGAKDANKFREFKESMQDYIQFGEGSNQKVTKEVSYYIIEGLEAASEQRYSTAVEYLYPIKDQFFQIGGSNTQRDVLNQILISSGLRSDNTTHNNIARKMLTERNTLKEMANLREGLNLTMTLI